MRTFRATDGRDVLLRRAEPDDAEGMLEVLAQAIDDGFTVRTREEMPTPEGQRQRVVERSADAGALLVVAIRDGVVVGELSFRADPRARQRHTGSFALAVRRELRGIGVGRALLELLIDWAREHPVVEKVCLGVYPDNERAIALYRKLGFVEEGRLVRDVKFGPDAYEDTIQMSRFVKERERS